MLSFKPQHMKNITSEVMPVITSGGIAAGWLAAHGPVVAGTMTAVTTGTMTAERAMGPSKLSPEPLLFATCSHLEGHCGDAYLLDVGGALGPPVGCLKGPVTTCDASWGSLEPARDAAQGAARSLIGRSARMSRMSLLNSPLLLGFDHFERTLERVAKASTDGYPPYNIERVGEDGLRITLAVAGFTMDQLDVRHEANQLTIRGKQTDDGSRVFLHRGIAARQFQRSFVLAEGIEVAGAVLDTGLLHIELVRPEPQANARTIEITTAPGSDAGAGGPETIDVETQP